MTTDQRPAARARHLRVRVVEGGKQKAELTLPAAAAAHLADMIPEEAEAKARERGINVAAVAAAAVAAGLPPGELFRLDGEKEIRVWLE